MTANAPARSQATVSAPRQVADFLRRYWQLAALIVLFTVATFLSDAFLRPTNLLNVARQVSINGLLAMGLTFVVLTANIDLSTGAMMQAVTMVFALLSGQPLVVGVVAVLLMGAFIGMLNGVITNYVKVDAFLTTVAMGVFLDGFALWINNGYPIQVKSAAFKLIGGGYVWWIPVPVIVLFLVAVAGHLILTRTYLGRLFYAIGGNEEAVRLSGVNTKNVKTIAFIISGITAGLAGAIMLGRLGLADPIAGQGLALDAVAATVVGGTRLGGGRGTIWGTIAGAIMLGVINNLFNLMNVSPYLQLMVKGLIIVSAVGLFRKK